MPRGYYNHGPRGGGGTPPRGGFNGRGRGRGRGRGSASDEEGARGRGRGRGRGGYIPMDVLEQPIQVWIEGPGGGAINRFSSPRGRGRGGSGFNSPRSGFSTPGRGANTPRGRARGGLLPIYPALEEMHGLSRGRSSFSPRGRRGGRGGKNLTSRLRGGEPLSKVLYEDRPYLRPIHFVRSVHTATLFTEEEEILRPTQETTDETAASHVPTADRIAHIFSGDAERDADRDHDSGEEELEEIDFSEIGRIQAQVNATAALRTTNTNVDSEEKQFTGFYIDTTPAQFTSSSSIAVERIDGLLGDEDDEEVIVYVAPHPRAGPVTPPTDNHNTDLSSNVSILTGLVHSSLSVADPRDGNPVLDPPENTALPSEQTSCLQSDIAGPSLNSLASQDIRDELPPDISEPAMDAPFMATYPVSNIVSPDPDTLPHPSEFLSTATTIATSVTASHGPDAPSSEKSTMVQSVMTIETDAPINSAETSISATEIVKAASSVSQGPTFNSVSFSFTATPAKKQMRRLHPVNSPRSLIPKRRSARHKPVRHLSFLGAMVSEAHLREETGGRERDPRKNEQRRGDSDVDWGDDSDEELTSPKDADIDQISDRMGGMDLDGDIDIKAMQSFVHSMSAEGSKQMSMDDIADIERMRQEDEESADGSHGSTPSTESEEEDREVDTVVRNEERLLTGDGAASAIGSDDDDYEYESSDDDDEEVTPRRSFQARLEKMRSKVGGKQRATVKRADDEDDEDENDDFDMQLDASWAANDESYLAHIQDMLDDNAGMLFGKDRQERNKLFLAIQNGALDVDEYEEMMGKPARRKKDKNRDLPPDLQAQWEKDREKKAENKRKRAQARAEAAADPLAKKKGGKKGIKDTLRAARMDADVDIPNRVIDLVSLEKQIRRFLEQLDGPDTLALPPADRGTRKNIHELATAFNLKSKSKGDGKKRYTTLIKTSRSGIQINEKKIGRIMRAAGKFWDGPERRNAKTTSLAKHREGEEVGKSAPKIGESNIGFKMLAAMGWSEGAQIGLSGGLEAPLVAVMKKTKLGLGATF